MKWTMLWAAGVGAALGLAVITANNGLAVGGMAGGFLALIVMFLCFVVYDARHRP